MILQVLKGTILVEIEVDCSGCYKAKELYCEKNIFIHCCTVNAKSYGLPGILVDSYHPDKKSRLQFVTYDGRYAVFNQLVYNPSTSPFTHEQLRNTIEYFDSNNNPEFKAKKHRLFPDERIIRIYEY